MRLFPTLPETNESEYGSGESSKILQDVNDTNEYYDLHNSAVANRFGYRFGQLIQIPIIIWGSLGCPGGGKLNFPTRTISSITNPT